MTLGPKKIGLLTPWSLLKGCRTPPPLFNTPSGYTYPLQLSGAAPLLVPVGIDQPLAVVQTYKVKKNVYWLQFVNKKLREK